MSSSSPLPAPAEEGGGHGPALAAEAAAAPAEGAVLPMQHQVGGHRAASEEEPPYMLRLAPHYILKIVQPGAKGERELAFYQKLFSDDDDEAAADDDPLRPHAAALRTFVPAFHGVKLMQGGALRYMIMEDLSDRDRFLAPPSSTSSATRGREGGRRRRQRGPAAATGTDVDEEQRREQWPSVLDVKMGRATHGPWASPAKAAKEKAKYPHQAVVGFRIIGMKIYDPATGTYAVESKPYGRGLHPDEVLGALARFFLRRSQPQPQSQEQEEREEEDEGAGGISGSSSGGGGGGSSRRMRRRGKRKRAPASELLEFYIRRLEALRAWFQGQRAARFWSSSLLFVDHEEAPSDSDTGSDDEGEVNGPDGSDSGSGSDHRHPCADVRMIDFAHVELAGKEAEDAAAAGCGSSGSSGSSSWREDENYMFGLASLLEHLGRLLARARKIEAGKDGGAA